VEVLRVEPPPLLPTLEDSPEQRRMAIEAEGVRTLAPVHRLEEMVVRQEVPEPVVIRVKPGGILPPGCSQGVVELHIAHPAHGGTIEDTVSIDPPRRYGGRNKEEEP
jgi:hypothetical protein